MSTQWVGAGYLCTVFVTFKRHRFLCRKLQQLTYSFGSSGFIDHVRTYILL